MADYTAVKIPAVPGDEQPGHISLVSAPGPQVMNGDFLILSLTTSDATGVVEFRGRHMRVDGEIVPFERTLTFSGTGTQSDVVATLSAGWIIGFSVNRVSGTLTDGEVQGSVYVGRNVGGLQQKVLCLASGGITNTKSLGLGGFGDPFLAGTQVTPAPEVGTVITGADPAVNTQWTITVPASTIYKVYLVRATLVTDATVANRQVSLQIDDGTTTLYQGYCGQNSVASTTNTFNWGAVGASSTASAAIQSVVAPFPIFLGPGYRLRSAVGAFQAGDDWGAPVAYVTSYSV
jgi:hypothetical protein